MAFQIRCIQIVCVLSAKQERLSRSGHFLQKTKAPAGTLLTRPRICPYCSYHTIPHHTTIPYHAYPTIPYIPYHTSLVWRNDWEKSISQNIWPQRLCGEQGSEATSFVEFILPSHSPIPSWCGTVCMVWYWGGGPKLSP